MEQTTNEANVQKTGGARLKKGGKTPVILAAVILAVLAAGYLALCFLATSGDTFYPNTTLNGVEVGSMTAETAAEAVERQLPLRTIDLFFNLNNEEETTSRAPDQQVTLGDLGFQPVSSYLISAKDALALQRDCGFFSAGVRYLKALTGDAPLSFAMEYNPDTFQSTVDALLNEVCFDAQDTAYTLVDTSISVTKATDGQTVDPSILASLLQNAYSWGSVCSLGVPATVLPAKTLTAQEIYDAVSGEVKNAGYDAATDTITPEQIGATFDVAAAQSLLDAAAPGDTVTIPADIEYPAVTAEDLKAVLFRDVLGSATTHVGGTAARISNVRLASAAVSGTVLNSGEVFSYNAATGQRTEAKGYQAAPAYVQGETVDEIGGGVCQPSSTLYLACLNANLEITERYAHRYVPSYIAKGMDATVSWGGPDYKFTNDTDYPIKIVATYSKGYLTMTLYGTKTDDITVKMTNKVLSSTAWETVYEDDATLAPGTETVKTTPYTGYKVETYRNLYDGQGNLISSTFEASSNYKVRNKVIQRGPAVETPVSGTETVPGTGTGGETVPDAGTGTVPDAGGETVPAPETGTAPSVTPEETTPQAPIVITPEPSGEPEGQAA